MFCNYCASTNPDDSLFCSACGKSIGRTRREAAPQYQPATVTVPGKVSAVASATPATVEAAPKSPADVGESVSESVSAREDKTPRGIGGWLAFFILSLTLFSPLVCVARLVDEWQKVPTSGADASLLGYIAGLDSLISISLALAGIYAGVRLLRVKPGAVRTAKRYLAVSAGYFILVGLIGVAGLIAQAGEPVKPDEMTTALVPGVRGLFYVVIWLSYLTKSKRVANTYPAN
jgi:hypothetical protein